MLALQKEMIRIALQEKDTRQAGRTHGQHAVPITAGFAMAEFVDRLGEAILRIEKLADELPGSFAGMCGAYNATSLLLPDPLGFEKHVLDEIGVIAARISTQIVPPEPTARLFEEIARASGILANMADNYRNLQRTEIAEVGEFFGETQVGSSTSPHKQNPKNWENVKGVWKIIKGRMITIALNEISEHERDLTNSQGMRVDDEIFAFFYMQVKRTTKILGKMHIDREKMLENLYLTGDQILSEAAQLILSDLGYSEAHEKIRVLAKEIRKSGKIKERHALLSMMQVDPELAPYMAKMTDNQLAALSDPRNYIGIAPQKTEEVCSYWMKKLHL
jgi:adenylosuccinate lyase